MLGSRNKELFSIQVFQIIDALLIWGSFAVASWFRVWFKSAFHGQNAEGYGLESIGWILFVIVPFTPLLLEMFGFYRNPMRKKFANALRQMALTLVFLGALLGGVMIVFKLNPGSRLILIIGMALSAVMILIRLLVARSYLQRRVQSGAKKERVVIAGTQKDIKAFLERMPESVTDYWEVCGEFDLAHGTADELEELLLKHSVERVIFAAENAMFREISEAVEICEAQGIEVWISADFIRTQISRPVFDTLGGRPMLAFRSTPELSWSLLAKAVMDKAGALTIILLTSPLWIFAYIGIKIASPGPAFFKQDRAGKYGKPFKMWKFRTMVMDAEAKLAEVKAKVGNEMDGPVFKLENDPRVFKFARLLRKLSIDELPQLINVLLGDMSLVGPRPLPCYEVEEFEKSVYRRRLSVKPGITCTWQAGGRNTITNFDDWVKLDLDYIDNWTLWLDIKILLKTVPAVLFGSGAK